VGFFPNVTDRRNYIRLTQLSDHRQRSRPARGIQGWASYAQRTFFVKERGRPSVLPHDSLQSTDNEIKEDQGKGEKKIARW